MVTLSKYILYIGHQSFLLQHPIHINTSCVTQCQTVLIAKNARLQHDFHNIGLTRSKMIIPVPFSGIRVLHRNIFLGATVAATGKNNIFFVGWFHSVKIRCLRLLHCRNFCWWLPKIHLKQISWENPKGNSPPAWGRGKKPLGFPRGDGS